MSGRTGGRPKKPRTVIPVPEELCRKADKIAVDVFMEQVRLGASFRRAVGMVYLRGVAAAATTFVQKLDDAAPSAADVPHG